MSSASWKIQSRKIPLHSISRHFSPWKLRDFMLDEYFNLIIVTESSGRRIQCPVNQLRIRHHFYSTVNQPFNLSLKYISQPSSAVVSSSLSSTSSSLSSSTTTTAVSATLPTTSKPSNDDFEMLLRFETMERMSAFESMILEAMRHVQLRTGVITDETLEALNAFFKERLLLQELSVSNSSKINQKDLLLTRSYSKKEEGEKKVIFDENLEMECLTWKAKNFSDLIDDRFSSSPVTTETIRCSEDSELIHLKVNLNGTAVDNVKDSNISNTTNNNMILDFQNLPYHKQNPHSKVVLRYGPTTSGMKLPIPKLKIVLMVVGTRGDVQPFCQLGKRLQQDGHRVRLATHACFREYVTSNGLEFYPLNGDPHVLSEFMVRTHGNIIPSLSDLIHEVPKNLAMISDIIVSCWYACVNEDPDDKEARPFIADAIISNPVTYGHIHCAEALGIPLHLMFPQPWLPTKAFPHPLSCMRYDSQWNTENYLSYHMVDQMLWLSMRGAINNFREKVLGLDPIRPAEGGWNMLNSNKVPFVKMWSSAIVPKPKDWPDYVDISGTFSDIPVNPSIIPSQPTSQSTSLTSSRTSSHDKTYESTSSSPVMNTPNIKSMKNIATTSTTYKPHPELEDFLSSGPKPIFIGFGSMVIDDAESLVRDFLDAAALVGARILIQSGWSEISQEKFYELALEAEKKAILVKETEDGNNQSVIFPSPRNQKSGYNFADNSNSKKSNVKSTLRSSSKTDSNSNSNMDNNIDISVGNKNVTITTREVLDNLLASADSNSPKSQSRHSDSDLQNSNMIVETNKVKTDETTTYFDTEADSGEEDYVTISPDDNIYDRADYEYENSLSLSSPTSLSLNIGRHVVGQVRGWFYGKSSTQTHGNTASTTTLSNSRSSNISTSIQPISTSKQIHGNGSSHGNIIISGSNTVPRVVSYTNSNTPSPIHQNLSQSMIQPALSYSDHDTSYSNSNIITNTSPLILKPLAMSTDDDDGDNVVIDNDVIASSSTTVDNNLKNTVKDRKTEDGEWDNIPEQKGWKASTHAILISQCPHNWLFQHVAAVIHHGGAGTTSSGLQAGLPTWICPFFGDQNFWGEMVYRRGLGPKPCPIQELTLSLIADSMNLLLSKEIQQKAIEISYILKSEDGVDGAANAFYRHLPVDSMLCDVSLFLGEARLSQVYCEDCDFKLCREVSERIHWGKQNTHKIYPCRYVDWKAEDPQTPTDGLIQGITGLVHEVADGVGDAIYKPMRGIYTEGIPGAAIGVVQGLVKGLITQPISGGSALISRVSAGIRASTLSPQSMGHPRRISMNSLSSQNSPSIDSLLLLSSSSQLSSQLSVGHSNSAIDVLIRRAKQYILDTEYRSITTEEDMSNLHGLHLEDQSLMTVSNTLRSIQEETNELIELIEIDHKSKSELIVESEGIAENMTEIKSINDSEYPNLMESDSSITNENKDMEIGVIQNNLDSIVESMNESMKQVKNVNQELSNDFENNTTMISDHKNVESNQMVDDTSQSVVKNEDNQEHEDMVLLKDSSTTVPSTIETQLEIEFMSSDTSQSEITQTTTTATTTTTTTTTIAIPSEDLIFSQSEMFIQTKDMKKEKDKVQDKEKENDFEMLWSHREKDVMMAYESAKQIRQLMKDITHTNARFLSLAEFTNLVEKAISRKENISSTNHHDGELLMLPDEEEDEGEDVIRRKTKKDRSSDSDYERISRQNTAFIAKTIAEQLSRNKGVIDYVDISLFLLEYGKDEKEGIWSGLSPTSQVNVHV